MGNGKKIKIVCSLCVCIGHVHDQFEGTLDRRSYANVHDRRDALAAADRHHSASVGELIIFYFIVEEYFCVQIRNAMLFQSLG